MHPDKLPLEIGERYWILRDSIQYCELYIMRILDFRVSFDSTQKVREVSNIQYNPVIMYSLLTYSQYSVPFKLFTKKIPFL